MRPRRCPPKRKAAAEAQKIVAIWNARQADGRALVGYGLDLANHSWALAGGSDDGAQQGRRSVAAQAM
jgi:hypothetical protein